MAASSLLALIDDITTLLDDVAVLSKVAAKKTTGVLGDDLALNAEQASGVSAERELPVVWAVAKGSFINKLILVPAALAISAVAPRAILPLLMIGGLFLCYEGFEKVAHKLLHSASEDAAHRAELAAATVNPAVDLVALEKSKIKGAIRTDFILSAEIVVIALGTMASVSFGQQVAALSFVAIAVTVLVYGLVAGIVKLDDLGLQLLRTAGPRDAVQRGFATFILRGAPVLMRTLSILGTAAMFTVGGSILVHGVPVLEHAMAGVESRVGSVPHLLVTVLTTLLDAVVGLVAGGVCVAVVVMAKRVAGKK